MLTPRDYQLRTVDTVAALWREKRLRVACVAPTGAGKTVIGGLVIDRYPGERWVWLAHTRDLVQQSAEELSKWFPGQVGIIMAGAPRTPSARIQVCSTQTLQARELLPEGHLILDEMHHYAAAEWEQLVGRLGERRCLGLTATPERADGVGLRGLFDELVVAAHYSELLRSGALVPCRVLRPAKRLRGIAKDPVAAYLAKGEGRVGFTFCRTVKLAREAAESYTAAGVPAACVDFETEGRHDIIKGLGSKYQMLTSVYALTEGVNVPAASCCVLARSVGHQSILLQIAGRILRSHPGKRDALLLDLAGVTWEHGLPTEDREYSLDGIRRKSESLSLRVCQQCGYTDESGDPTCKRCGFRLPPKDVSPRVMNAELGEHSQLVKELRLSSLLIEARKKGFEDDWIAMRFKAEFGKFPKLPQDVERQMALFQKLKQQAMQNGVSMAQAAVKYKAYYGVYPPRGW